METVGHAENTLSRSRLRLVFAYTGSMSVGFREEEGPKPLDRYLSTIAIAAAIIAAVRLAKMADLDLSVTKVQDTVRQSVFLARTILDEARRLL